MAKNKNKVTCGILLHTPNGVLLCHPTGRKFEDGCYDIPKGVKEENETEWECAVRELREETGIDITNVDLRYIANHGRFAYNKEKDIHLFSVRIANTIKPIDLKCDSLIDGTNKPEVNGYLFTNDIIPKVFKSLKKVLESNDLVY